MATPSLNVDGKPEKVRVDEEDTCYESHTAYVVPLKSSFVENASIADICNEGCKIEEKQHEEVCVEIQNQKLAKELRLVSYKNIAGCTNELESIEGEPGRYKDNLGNGNTIAQATTLDVNSSDVDNNNAGIGNEAPHFDGSSPSRADKATQSELHSFQNKGFDDDEDVNDFDQPSDQIEKSPTKGKSDAPKEASEGKLSCCKHLRKTKTVLRNVAVAFIIALVLALFFAPPLKV
eukprot:gene17301-8880_t